MDISDKTKTLVILLLLLLLLYFSTTDQTSENISTENNYTQETEQPTVSEKPEESQAPPIIPQTVEPTVPPTTSAPRPAELSLQVTDTKYGLCCGIIPGNVTIEGTATLENTGDLTAHNVGVTFELLTKEGVRIRLNGADVIERDLGDIRGGERVVEMVEFNIDLSDGLYIQENGALAVFEVASDEKNLRSETELVMDLF
jgi:hypothetical protein